MAFNGKKAVQIARSKGIKTKDFVAFVFPDRSGNTSLKDVERNNNPTAATVERIADLLQCSIDSLFDRDVPQATTNVSCDHIEAAENSTAFKGTNTCDQRLLDIIQRQGLQIDRAQEHLAKAQQQIDRFLTILEGSR